MAIVKINGKEYETTLGADGQYLTPPKPVEEVVKPEDLQVNLLSVSAEALFPARSVLKAWLKDNPIANILFNKDKIEVTKANLLLIKTIVEEDRDDGTSPMNTDTANILLALIQDLEEQLK